MCVCATFKYLSFADAPLSSVEFFLAHCVTCVSRSLLQLHHHPVSFPLSLALFSIILFVYLIRFLAPEQQSLPRASGSSAGLSWWPRGLLDETDDDHFLFARLMCKSSNRLSTLLCA